MDHLMLRLVWLFCSIFITTCQQTDELHDADPKDITKVHLIFMNHLDVGFNGIYPELGFVNNVINKYFHVYFPRAIQVGFQLKILGYVEKLVYTTHPWLVSMFLDCPPNLVLADIKLQCPTKAEVDNFTAAVDAGIITWHAGSMNNNNEMFDESMMEFSLRLAEDLDKRFGIKRSTRVLSQRDVPGMSIALLPIFARNGIEGISVGVNGVTAPPAVPKIFNWQFNNVSVMSMWHPGGYPNNPGKFPDIPGGLSSRDCVTFKGFNEAMCYGFRSDNSGPPLNISEVLLFYEISRGQFPNAQIIGSTFEDFVSAAKVIKSQLPIVTKEFGDGWIQGSASDPLKCAKMRGFFRARTKCLEKGEVGCPFDSRMYNASRFLTKLGEHTWGISHAGDTVNWENKDFYNFLENRTAKYYQGTLSWIEQRDFYELALDALGDHPLAAEVLNQWDRLKPSIPDINNFTVVSNPSSVMKCSEGFTFQFGKDGSVIQLIDNSGNKWASTDHPVGQYIYQTYNQTDFDQFDKKFKYSDEFFLGIGKPNMSKNAKPLSQVWEHRVVNLFRAKDGSCKFGVFLEPVDVEAVNYYGAPPKVFIMYSYENGPQGTKGISVTLEWLYKPPTRLPESIFFSFKPLPQEGLHWMIHKLGQMIDPLNVIQNGSQTQHGIDSGVYYVDESSKGLAIHAPDTPIVNILSSDVPLSAIPQRLLPLTDVTGVAFNVYNNVWNVNYIFWYPYLLEDMNQKFKYFLDVGYNS